MNTSRFSQTVSQTVSTLGRSFARLLNTLAVLAICMAVVGCTPDVSDLRVQGIRQFRERQHIESMATLRYALERSPSDAESNYYMGLNYRTLADRKFRDGDVPAARRQLDLAIIYFTQAVKSWPNYMTAIAHKNESLELRGKYGPALELAQDVADNNRGTAAHFVFLGNEYRERADYDNAVRAYKKALATDPDNSKAYAGLGKLYLQVGDRQLAMDSFRRAYELNKAEPGVVEGLSQLQLAPDVSTASHNP